MNVLTKLPRCRCGEPLGPCPVCSEAICYGCEDWQEHHSARGWARRQVRLLFHRKGHGEYRKIR